TDSGKLRIAMFAFLKLIAERIAALEYGTALLIKNRLPGKTAKISEVYRCVFLCSLHTFNFSETKSKAPLFNMAAFGSKRYFLGRAKVAFADSAKSKPKISCSVFVKFIVLIFS